MTKQIVNLKASGLITDYERACESLLLLTAKLRQESYNDSNAFIWKLCASYQLLNSIILGFRFPISRYADSIENLDD